MRRNLIKNLLISFAMLANATYAQFYYYSGHLRGSKARGIVEDVYRINLKTGEKELILTGVGTPVVLHEINKIVFKSIPQLEICIYDAEKGIVDTLSHLGKYEKVYQIHTVPPENNIFLGLVKLDARIIDKELQTLETTERLIDKNSYSIIDTICAYYMNRESVISRDGKRIYYLLDSTNGIFFETLDPKIDKIVEQFSIKGYEELNIYGRIGFYSALNGYVFLGYLTRNGNGNLTSHYVLCDPENRKSTVHLIWPTGIHPYAEAISPSGDLIFQDRGNIYIFDGQTAQLKTRYKFQASNNPKVPSKIFIIGDSLYFFPEDPEKSDASRFDNIGHGDLSQVQSNSFLVEMLLNDVEEAYQKGKIDNQGIYISLSKKLENAKKHFDGGQTKQTGNVLNAFLNEVEAQKDKHLAKETYSLLKFNVECIIKRLEE